MTTTTTAPATITKKLDFEVTPETKPTLAEVRQKLESGGFEETQCVFRGELYTQTTELTPPAITHEAALRDAGYADVRVKLVECYRLGELAGYAVGERGGIRVETKLTTAQQAELRRYLIVRRDAFIRMARDSKISEDFFHVNFGEGNATHVLAPAQALLFRVKQHGPKLRNQVLAKKYERELEDSMYSLRNSDIGQEAGKYQVSAPTGISDRCRYAMYENLLHVSRAGLNTFVDNPAVQEEFRLKVLRPAGSGGGAVGLDDDDAPLVPATGDTQVPAGTVTAVAERETPVRTTPDQPSNND